MGFCVILPTAARADLLRTRRFPQPVTRKHYNMIRSVCPPFLLQPLPPPPSRDPFLKLFEQRQCITHTSVKLCYISADCNVWQKVYQKQAIKHNLLKDLAPYEQ
jgi:hypothetical protein